MSQSQSLAASKAPHPENSPDKPLLSPVFNDADADILVRSSDNVLFHLHKLILAKASPVFAGMFTIPQPPEASSQGGELQVSQVLCLTETGAVLHHLLQHIYPVKRPVIRTPAEIHRVLEAARKYEIDTVTAAMKELLLSPAFIEQHPLAAYALACGYGLPDAARAAARQTLSIPLPGPFIPELELATAASFHRLLTYRADCKAAAQTVPWLQRITKWSTSKGGLSLLRACDRCDTVAGGVDTRGVKCWLAEYNEQARKALQEKPIGAVVKTTTTLDPPMQTAAKCNRCVKVAFSLLTDFAEILAGDVEKAVSKVVLTV